MFFPTEFRRFRTTHPSSHWPSEGRRKSGGIRPARGVRASPIRQPQDRRPDRAPAASSPSRFAPATDGSSAQIDETGRERNVRTGNDVRLDRASTTAPCGARPRDPEKSRVVPHRTCPRPRENLGLRPPNSGQVRGHSAARRLKSGVKSDVSASRMNCAEFWPAPNVDFGKIRLRLWRPHSSPFNVGLRSDWDVGQHSRARELRRSTDAHD